MVRTNIIAGRLVSLWPYWFILIMMYQLFVYNFFYCNNLITVHLTFRPTVEELKNVHFHSRSFQPCLSCSTTPTLYRITGKNTIICNSNPPRSQKGWETGTRSKPQADTPRTFYEKWGRAAAQGEAQGHPTVTTCSFKLQVSAVFANEPLQIHSCLRRPRG